MARSFFGLLKKLGFRDAEKVTTRDPVHRFYQNQMQINGGANDKFAALTDAGALTMGYYSNSASLLPMWQIAQKYVSGRQFLPSRVRRFVSKPQFLICACTPSQANPNDTSVSVLNPDGISLKADRSSPPSAIAGAPVFVGDGRLTPDGFAVNTIQPPFQPSGNAPASGGDPRYADSNNPSTLSVQSNTTIGDLLSDVGKN